MSKRLLVTPASLVRFLSMIVAVLLLADLASIYCRTFLGYDFQFIHTFDFNREYNIPSLYATLTLLLCGLLMLRIGGLPSEYLKRWYWKILGVLFIFLSLDEMIGIHENTSNESETLLHGFNAGGYFHFAWVVPYAILIVVMGLFFLKFIVLLPTQTKVQVMLAAILFVAGALGMEMVSGRLVFLYGDTFRETFSYGILYTIEEILEMSGTLLLIHALGQYYILRSEGQHLHYDVLIKPNA